MSERTRKCGFCDLDVTESGAGHAVDCERSTIPKPPAAEGGELIAALPAAYRQYAQTLEPGEVEQLLENNRLWRKNPELLLDHLLDLSLLSIQILERMMTKPGPARSGAMNQRMAIRELTDISTRIVPLLQAAKSEGKK